MDVDPELILNEEISDVPMLPNITANRFVFFLIWPFASLVLALKRFREPYAKTIFWFFCIYFGFVFVYGDIVPGRATKDSAIYAEILISQHEDKISLVELISSFYSKKGGQVDIYQPTITWLVSLVSGDPRLLFAVFAAIFGFFYSQNLWIVFSRIEKSVGLLLFLLMIYYALINPIWYISGVRMWTAAQIFAFGILKYFIQNERKGLFWAAASILVHFSFIFPVVVLLLWLIISERAIFFFALYVISAIISEMDIEIMNKVFAFLPDVFESRIEGYTSESYLSAVNEASSQASLLLTITAEISKSLIYFWVSVLYFTKKKWSDALPRCFSLFLFILLLGSFTNLAQEVPSFSRFFTLTYLLFFAILIIILGRAGSTIIYRKYLLFSSPFILYLVLYQFRIGFEFIGVLTFLGNPPLSLILDSQTPVIDFIKQLL